MNKYTYIDVIQSNYNGYGWEDEAAYETPEEKEGARHDLKEYQIAYAGTGTQVRLVSRRMPNE